MTLQNEYRPDTFENFIGNESLIKNLTVMIEKKKVPNALLFSGESGCGKTTLARIVAKELKCSEFDIYEFNSSNTRGIDTARDIIKTMHYRPLGGDVKFYILDEVHKTTPDFQNAMLKAIEEPPAYVYFVLCTTDPGKLIKTIQNRCTQFSVATLKEKDMLFLLRKIARSEKIKFSLEVYEAIINEADGSPRKALKILDKIRDIKEDDNILSCIREASIDEAETIELCRALIGKSNWKTIAGILKSIKAEPETVRRTVLGYMSSVLLNSNNPKAAVIMECFENHFYDTGKPGLVLACFRVIE